MKGYLQVTDGYIPHEEALRAQERWDELTRAGKTPVLNSNIKFVQFQEGLISNNVIVRCGYCGQWAAVKTSCKHCGAVVIE